MSIRLLWLGLVLAISGIGARAQLVTPPTFTSISLPATATLGQTITVSATAQGNYSDNSDGNDWNAGDYTDILRVIVQYQAPGGSPTSLNDWMPTWQTPNTFSTSLTLNTAGTWSFSFQAMDGRPWYSDQLVYTVVVSPPPQPSITSTLSYSTNQSATASYQITATNSPTSYGATGLPPGLSINTSTGLISGATTTAGSYSVALSAVNANGTGTATLSWTVVAASIVNNGSISPSSIVNGQSITITRNGTANFGIAWTEATIWPPSGSAISLSHAPLGSASYTPVSGPGSYALQYRIVDTYYNYQDQWLSFTVAGISPPTGLLATSIGSTFVVLSWSAPTVGTVDHYAISKDGVFLGTATATTFTDSSASPGETHSYSVEAVDGSGSPSTATALSVTTAPPLEVFTPL